MKIKIFLTIIIALVTALVLSASDRTYKVTVMYEADDQGRVLTQKPYQGWVILKADGTYSVQLHFNDTGRYQFTRANAQQPNDTVFFYSSQNTRYFAYPRGNMMALWLNKPRPGVNLWVNAQLTANTNATTPPPATTQPTQPIHAPQSGSVYLPGLVQSNRFTKTVMFSSTSAGSYFYYDQSTGSFSHDQTGVIFWPNGSYYLKANFGYSETIERGSYMINGRKVIIRFDDGSAFTFDIAANNRDLHYYSNGMLISEFFFLSAK